MRSMKILIATLVVIASMTSLSACSILPEPTPEEQQVLDEYGEILTKEGDPDCLPPGMTRSGKEIFGDGNVERDDIFAKLEKKIWG